MNSVVLRAERVTNPLRFVLQMQFCGFHANPMREQGFWLNSQGHRRLRQSQVIEPLNRIVRSFITSPERLPA